MEKYVNTRLVRVTNSSNMIELSCHPDLTLDVIKAHSNLPWNFAQLMKHPNFRISWVAEFPFQYWDWNQLSHMVDVETLSQYAHLFWNWRLITQKTSTDDMLKHPELPWDFSSIVFKQILPEHIHFFRAFKNRIPQWKWHYLSKNLTWNAFRDSIDLPWMWDIAEIRVTTEEFIPSDVILLQLFEDLCNWVNLTINVHIDIINENPNLPWKLEYLQWNKTTWKTPTQSIESCIREWHAANIIKKHWKNAISNPDFKMCKDRLWKEFKELEGY
jgi:hypothetical protein